MLPLTGRVFSMIMQVIWWIIRSFRCSLTNLHATCTYIMLMILHRTDSHRSQKTEVIPTCMGYCGQNQSFWLLVRILHIVHLLLMVLIDLCYLQNHDLLATLRKSKSSGGTGHILIVWFCKVLPLFQVESKTDSGWKRHSCAFVSVLEEYSGPIRPGNCISYLAYLELLLRLDYLCILVSLIVHSILIFVVCGSLVGSPQYRFFLKNDLFFLKIIFDSRV